MADAWVLMKRNMFYRPNNHGYTSNIAEAGRYSENDAKARADVGDGVTAHLASEFEQKPDMTITPSEYFVANIKGWHQVCWNVDGFGNVGIRCMANKTRSPI